MGVVEKIIGGKKKLKKCLEEKESWGGVWGKEEVEEVFGGKRKLKRCLGGGGS